METRQGLSTAGPPKVKTRPKKPVVLLRIQLRTARRTQGVGDRLHLEVGHGFPSRPTLDRCLGMETADSEPT